ncbi:MAG: cupredoxin domain-containing protein [Armatimonadetes bacterium]|nr:cupredoxin domain-containing protein [Armatimonadota bacterium]
MVRTTRQRLTGIGLVLPLAVLVGLAVAPPRPVRGQEEALVRIQSDDYAYGASFEPRTLEVTAGTTVVWVNDSSATHTVTARDGAFDSGQVASGSRYSVKLDRAATYDYYCKIHASMTGLVVVTSR